MSYSCADAISDVFTAMVSAGFITERQAARVNGADDPQDATELILRVIRQQQRKRQPRVLVEVWGGVAYLTRCPRGVRVDIVDHDNEGHG